jgi:L-seryl-tRNA(Ser) seleniumtransferase
MIDRFGNPIDPSVGYARGTILSGPETEVEKLRFGRQLVRQRLETCGPAGLFDLTGLPRAWPLRPEDLPKLESQLSFYAHFEGKAEPLALAYVRADPARHDALLVNRVSAAAFAVMAALLEPGAVVVSLSPRAGSRSHPSVQRAVERVGGRFCEAVGLDAVRGLLDEVPAARMLVVTPITADKRHLPPSEYAEALALARRRGLIVFADDAHMSARCSFFGDPTGFQLGDPDVLVFSSDKHMIGPRAGVLVGRKDLIDRVRRVALEFGLEAQSGQYVAVMRALEQHDPMAIKSAGELVYQLLPMVQAAYGQERAYLAGPGVAIGGEDALEIACEMSGVQRPALVPVEAATIVSLHMLRQHGLANVAALSMPGSAPTIRIMMFRDGHKAGIARMLAGLDDSFKVLAGVLEDPDAARDLILGESRAPSGQSHGRAHTIGV